MYDCWHGWICFQAHPQHGSLCGDGASASHQTRRQFSSLVFSFGASDNRFAFLRKRANRFYGVVNIGLANSSGDAVSGCSAFQRIAAVIRVRPLG